AWVQINADTMWRASTRVYHSSSASQADLDASDGMRQSPRGDRLTEPTLGPSGDIERLYCWSKKRVTNTRSHPRSAASPCRPAKAWRARNSVLRGPAPSLSQQKRKKSCAS